MFSIVHDVISVAREKSRSKPALKIESPISKGVDIFSNKEFFTVTTAVPRGLTTIPYFTIKSLQAKFDNS